VKARKVQGVDPDGRAADEVAKIVAVRLGELCAFMPAARDPQAVHTLHDMRIAAKRLRYVLELFAPAFGPYAQDAAKQAKKLQDVIGEIHDCDVTRPRIAALRAELPADDPAQPGLAALDRVLAARRDREFVRFLQRWDKLEDKHFRTRLTEAITSRSHDGNGSPAPAGIPSGESPA
jgi:CHAD domain-containing protein